MSLTRSASGPAGGLTINTGAANAFGATASKPSAAGTLFGSAANTPNTTTTAPATNMATAGSLFGGGGAQKTGGGLFGNTQATTAPAAGGLFGAAPAAATTATPPTGGLFGTNPTTASSGTGLFGNAAGATQGQAPAGGLLSATTTATSQGTPTPTGQKPAGLFGNTATAQQAPAAGTTSLFGQKPAGTSLFGNTAPTQQTTATTGGFGQSTTAAKPGLNTSTFGQPAAQVSAVQINYDSIRHRTRFDDLAKPVQDEIAMLDKGIQRVIKMRDEIGEFMPQHEKDIEQLGRDVSFVESKFRIVHAALDNDVQTVKALQDQTRKNAADARLCFRGADNLKLPAHYHQTGLFASQPPAADSNGADAALTHADAQDLITYFNRICDDIEKSKARLDEYRGSIERDMPGVENGLYEQIRSMRDRSTTSAVVQDKLNEVLMALRDTGSAIVAQAGQIADTRERLSRLQAGIVDSGVYGLSMNA